MGGLKGYEESGINKARDCILEVKENNILNEGWLWSEGWPGPHEIDKVIGLCHCHARLGCPGSRRHRL